jgi:hypothetical protein
MAKEADERGVVMQEIKMHKWGAPSIAEDWGRFKGDAVFVVGTGTSLAGFDYGRLRGHTVIALNDAIKALPDATYHLYGDSEIYARYWSVPYGVDTKIVVQNAVAHVYRSAPGWPHGEKVRVFTRPQETAIFTIARSTDELWMTRTVATAAMMMAWKLGATDIYLLGVDCYRLPDGVNYADGTKHKDTYVAVGTTRAGNIVEDRHHAWMQAFEVLHSYWNYQAAHHNENIPRVYTLSEDSPCTTWPKCKIEDVL